MQKVSPHVRGAGFIAVALALMLVLPGTARAQSTIYTACYVPDAGAVYVVGEQDTPSSCLESSHVEFSFSGDTSAVTTDDLADGAVTTPKVADGAITNTKLSTDAVDSDIVQDGSLTESDLGSSVLTATGAANVSANGTLLQGKNVSSVAKPGTGTYEVTFTSAVDISTAYLLVSPGLTTTCATAHSVEKNSTQNYAFVLFVDTDGNRVDCAFSLLVF